MKLCISLCCGLDGQAAAFKTAPGWEVVSIDIERKFRPTIQADVMHLPLRKGIKPKALLMAPPCNCTSMASIYRHWKDHKPIDQETVDSIRLLRYLKDGFWRILGTRLSLDKLGTWLMYLGLMAFCVGMTISLFGQSFYSFWGTDFTISGLSLILIGGLMVINS